MPDHDALSDKGFALSASPLSTDTDTRTDDLVTRIVAELIELLGSGHQHLQASFALTAAESNAIVVVSDGEQTSRLRAPAAILPLLREHRHRSAQLDDEPWWRFIVTLQLGDTADIEFDYGTEPFPAEQLFPAPVYQADLQVYPRKRLPMWLAAYLSHAGRQIRTPELAASQSRLDRAAGHRGIPVDHGLPPLPLMWARWATISAAFVAEDSPWGPRISTSLAWFEGSTRSGSTLHLLPGNRAVLSGGVWNATELDTAYNDGVPLPRLEHIAQHLDRRQFLLDPSVEAVLPVDVSGRHIVDPVCTAVFAAGRHLLVGDGGALKVHWCHPVLFAQLDLAVDNRIDAVWRHVTVAHIARGNKISDPGGKSSPAPSHPRACRAHGVTSSDGRSDELTAHGRPTSTGAPQRPCEGSPHTGGEYQAHDRVPSG